MNSHPVDLRLPEPHLRGLARRAEEGADLRPGGALLAEQCDRPLLGHVEVLAGGDDLLQHRHGLRTGTPGRLPVTCLVDLLIGAHEEPVDDFLRRLVRPDLHASSVLDAYLTVKGA